MSNFVIIITRLIQYILDVIKEWYFCISIMTSNKKNITMHKDKEIRKIRKTKPPECNCQYDESNKGRNYFKHPGKVVQWIYR